MKFSRRPAHRAMALPAALLAAGWLAAVPSGAARAQTYYGVQQGTCDRSALSNALEPSSNNILGSALGAAAGGLLGSQFGGGSGKSLMTVVGVLGGALVGGMVGRSMEPPDQACINQTLEHGPTGRPVAWQNPDNGARYQVTPTATYQEDGRPCRRYTTTAVIDGQEQTLHGRACRQPDGTWKTE